VLTLYLEGRVPPGGQDALVLFLLEAREFYEAPGGLRVRLQWDDEDPCRFREIMEYADRAAYDADQERVRNDPAMGTWLRRWHALLDGDVSVRTYVEHDLD
jgi:quinol monooxygenase YgiN